MAHGRWVPDHGSQQRKGRMPAPERASEMLQKLLFEKGKPIVLLLDEIDFLLDRKQRVIYRYVLLMLHLLSC